MSGDAPDYGSGSPIMLRVSRFLVGAYAVAILLASCGVGLGLMPWFSADVAVAIAGAAACVLGALAFRRLSLAPVELRWLPGSGWLFAIDRSGRLIAGGPLAGCTQWTDLLLVLRVRDGCNLRPLLVAADALDTDTFRMLSAAARRAAGQI
jgi:hypothetical protein